MGEIAASDLNMDVISNKKETLLKLIKQSLNEPSGFLPHIQ